MRLVTSVAGAAVCELGSGLVGGVVGAARPGASLLGDCAELFGSSLPYVGDACAADAQLHERLVEARARLTARGQGLWTRQVLRATALVYVQAAVAPPAVINGRVDQRWQRSVDPSSYRQRALPTRSMPMPSADDAGVLGEVHAVGPTNATRSRSSSRLLISAAKAVSVAATKRRDTADCSPARSLARPDGLPCDGSEAAKRSGVNDGPASIFSSASCSKISVDGRHRS